MFIFKQTAALPRSASFVQLFIITCCLVACNLPHKGAAVTTSSDYQKGESFYNVNNDSAFYYFNKTAAGSHDSLEIAMSYTYMAMIQSDAGDYFGSQESLLQSLKHLNEKKTFTRAYFLSDYNELGSVNLNLKNYDAAIAYYDEALRFTEEDDSKIIALSNKAVAYQKKQQYAQAIAIYESILNKSKTDAKRYARILSNMALTKWLQDSNYHAAPDLLHALRIQENEDDKWGLNASYAHMADYYFYSRPDSAFIYASRMYNIAQQLNSPDDELEALGKMLALGPPENMKKYFSRYQYLNDSLQTSRNNAKNQFALIRYDVAKNKADNLSLQKENAEKKTEILLQWVMLIGLTTAAFIIFFWYRKRRQRMLREQQLKTSQKVHDIVANGLYHVMSKIEYGEELNKEMLLDDIEVLYEQSRNISYDYIEETPDDYYKSITSLLESFGSESTRILIVGNSKEIWNTIKPKVKKELTYVLRELMINMKKHSEATNVVVRFERQGNGLEIVYTDNGKGLPADFHYNNGLRNTETRISNIGGNISFDNSTPKGLKIQLNIPIA